MTRPDIDVLREYLSYDKISGKFTWIKSPKATVKIGAVAGSLKPSGYVYIKFKGMFVAAHQMAWAFHTGSWPEKPIDHIDRNESNNAIDNLRLATLKNNSWNTGLSRSNTSGFKGVSLCKANATWIAVVTKSDGKKKRLSGFKTKEEAAHAYNKAAIEYHGDFAVLNPVGGVFTGEQP